MRPEWLVHDMTSSEHNSRAKKRKKKTTGKMERERTNDDKKEAWRKRKSRTGRQIVTRRGCEMVGV